MRGAEIAYVRPMLKRSEWRRKRKQISWRKEIQFQISLCRGMGGCIVDFGRPRTYAKGWTLWLAFLFSYFALVQFTNQWLCTSRCIIQPARSEKSARMSAPGTRSCVDCGCFAWALISYLLGKASRADSCARYGRTYLRLQRRLKPGYLAVRLSFSMAKQRVD